MVLFRPMSRLAILGGLVLAGCASPPSPEARVEQIPKVTALYNKAMAAHAHRFRKPLRDEDERLLRLLAEECDKALARTQAWENSARLTAADDAAANEIRGEIAALQASLAGLRDAARRQDLDAMRRLHLTALASYARVRNEVGLVER